MLGKVLKKDFNSTWRFFLPLMGGYIVAAIVGKILFEILLSVIDSAGHTSAFSNGVAIFSVFYLIICLFYLIACYLMTSVFVVYDFYKTMVSTHGYLTHTLPVKTSTLIWSKILIAIMWQLAVNLMVGLSFMLILTGHISKLPVKEFFKLLLDSWDLNFTTYSFYTFLNMVLDCFHRPLMFFACIAIGQLWKEHRIFGAILSYVAIYIVSQILNTVAMIVTGFSARFSDFPYNGYLLYTFLFGLITTIGFFLITNYILSEKLNLE